MSMPAIDDLATFAEAYPSVASWILFMLTFHPMSLIFEVLDVTNLLYRYKIYRPTPATPSYRQMLPRVLFNQVFILLPCMLLVTRLGWSYQPKPSEPGTVASILGIITLTPILHEVSFYVIHRYVLHSRWGFTYFNHALHHASKAHSAVSAMYMSSADFLLEIVLPYMVPLCFVSHLNYVSNMFCLTLLPVGAFGGLYEHSGYNFFPDVPALDTRVHGLHHIFYHCSFADGVGAPSVLDSVMGTVCASVGPVSAASRNVMQWLAGHTKATKTELEAKVERIEQVEAVLAK